MSARILLANGSFRDEDARIVRDAGAVEIADGDIVPLVTYLDLAPARRAGLGVWLGPADEPAHLAESIASLALVAVDFPVFRDGRGFSTATLLRTRYGFRGDLRAIGDVLIDQLFYLRRVGFSSFALRADQDPEFAVAALRTFTDVYQGSVDQPLPYFRRRAVVSNRRWQCCAKPRKSSRRFFPPVSAPKTWWCWISSGAMTCRSKSSRSTPAACRKKRIG
jgi:uncharacterized protein (DUF934 family)